VDSITVSLIAFAAIFGGAICNPSPRAAGASAGPRYEGCRAVVHRAHRDDCRSGDSGC
jgi:hypothetical protein